MLAPRDQPNHGPIVRDVVQSKQSDTRSLQLNRPHKTGQRDIQGVGRGWGEETGGRKRLGNRQDMHSS